MSLPVLSRPPADPPTSPLPVIPQSQSRSTGSRKSISNAPSRLRTPRSSAIGIGRVEIAPAPESPEGKTLGKPAKAPTLKKSISIGSFPQPPNSTSRPSTATGFASPTSPRKPRVGEGVRTSTASLRQKKPTPRYSSGSSAYRGSETPSLLNSALAGTIPTVDNKRASDGLSSAPSPPQSRTSSANGSYSTNATTLEELDEDRGRDRVLEDTSPKSGKSKEQKGNVTVSVRVRPDAAGNDPAKAEGEWMVDGRRSLIAYRGKEGGDYVYDNVFGTYDDNAKVYDSAAKRLVRRVMEGYHGTVFAYGMTGTGKTFSMQGTMSSPGVIPLAITDIFSYIRETPQREFLLRVSYLEIYNEKINDLLAPPSTGGPQEEIKLREDSRRGVYATPLKEEIVQSPTQLLRVIHRGDMARRTGRTQWNARSSRSHAVVQIVVESRERVGGLSTTQENKRVAMLPSGVRVSTLSLIDLAGSEKAADDKERRAEGAHINKSLLTLGTVISKLSTKDKYGNPVDKDGKHLPYRDSKLTRLLQPALSGNSLISILCTIQIGAQGTSATSNTHTIETLNTLKFASRAKNNIVSHAKRAVEEVGSGVNAGLLERYRSEIASLRAQLENQKKSPAAEKSDDAEDSPEPSIGKEIETRHEEQMLEMQLARTALKERIEHLNRLILCSKSTGVNSGMTSALGHHGRMSAEYSGPRSVRSSASHSTLGNFGPSVVRHSSMTSINGGTSTFPSFVDEDDDSGDYGDGMASLQAQNRALQADLQDKNRYITTLEKRLLQARRSSHSRTSMGFSRAPHEGDEVTKQLDAKDAIIADLQKTVNALRSAVRQRTMAGSGRDHNTPSLNELTPESSSSEFKDKSTHAPRIQLSDAGSTSPHSSLESIGKPLSPRETRAFSPAILSPIALLSPNSLDKGGSGDKKRRSVDEMSKMLDEMIQDKVESGHLVKGRTGSVRIPPRLYAGRRHSRRTSSHSGVTPLNTMISAIRESDPIAEPVVEEPAVQSA